MAAVQRKEALAVETPQQPTCAASKHDMESYWRTRTTLRSPPHGTLWQQLVGLGPHGNAIHQSVGKRQGGLRPHRHLAAVSGNGRRSRLSRRARNSGASRESLREVGRAVKMRAANGPACESSKAVEEASSSGNKARWQKPLTAWDAASHECCHAVVRLERADEALLHGVRSARTRVQSQRRTTSRGQFEVTAPPKTHMQCRSLGQVAGPKSGRA